MAMTNTLVYYDTAKNKAVKILIVNGADYFTIVNEL
jgi:hypothetical protein